jgi:GAG-pre-integrase domain
VSIGRLDDAGFDVTFADGKCTIREQNGELVGTVPKSGGGLYRVSHESDTANLVADVLTLDQFHRQMGHISPEMARRLVAKGFVTGVKLEDSLSGPFFCESCIYVKATRKPVPKSSEGTHATKFGDVIHSNLWGPAPVATKGGKRYYITFTNDMSRLTHLYLLRTKNEAFGAYKEYQIWCNVQLDANIKTLHSDRGGEYLGTEFISYLKSKGTTQKLTMHDTPQHNGVAEHRNRTIVERIRALLHASRLPRFLWGEAARHVVWLMNRTSTRAVNGKTPYEATFGKKPDLCHVCEWGEKVWVRTETGDKLGERVTEGRWIGIDKWSKGFRINWPDKQTVSVEQNVHLDNQNTSGSHLEGEDWEFIETKTDIPPTAPNTAVAPTPSQPVPIVEQPLTSTDMVNPPDTEPEAPAK